MTYAVFSFTPAGTTAAGEVGVNVQDVPPLTHTLGHAARPRTCDGVMEQCKVTPLPDGSVLRTYAQRSSYGDRTGTMLTADLLRPDHVRVVAFSSNGYDVSERDERTTRDQPVLTIGQLTAAVRQGWWGARLPTCFTGQGAQLKPYTALGGAAAASAHPSTGPSTGP